MDAGSKEAGSIRDLPRPEEAPPEAARASGESGGLYQFAATEQDPAGAAIGTVEGVVGEAFLVRDGERVPLTSGTALHQGDVIETGESGEVEIALVDRTVFRLGFAAILELTEVRWDPELRDGVLKLFVAQGGFWLQSGLVAETNPDGMIVDTPVGRLQAWGATVLGLVRPNAEPSNFTLLANNDDSVGLAQFTNNAARALLTEVGHTISVDGLDSPFDDPLELSFGELAQLYEGAFGELAVAGLIEPAAGEAQVVSQGSPLIEASLSTIDGFGEGTGFSIGDLDFGGFADGIGGGETLFGILGAADGFAGSGVGTLSGPVFGASATFGGLSSVLGGPGATAGPAFASVGPQAFLASAGIEPDIALPVASCGEGLTPGNDGVVGNGVDLGPGDDSYGGRDDPSFGGQDFISDSGGNDELCLELTEVLAIDASRAGTSLELVNLRSANPNDKDKITISNYFDTDPTSPGTGRIEEFRTINVSFVFADLLPPSFAGTNGNDFIVGFESGDSIEGGSGNDALYGAGGVDTLSGDAGDDQLSGGGGDDTLNGGDGNDRLHGGAGNDTIDGGDGDDTAYYGGAAGGVTVDLGIAGAQQIGANEDADTLISIERVIGSDFDDTLTGADGADFLEGRGGDDSISGLGGNDRLLGGLGDDTITGGDGDDALSGGPGNDVLEGGAGNDAIDGGLGNDILDGGDGDDVLHGYDGDDIIFGGDGDDTLIGLGGSDRLFGGDGDDKLGGGGLLRREDRSSTDPRESSPRASGEADGNDLLEGGAGNDILFMSVGTDTFDGGTGVDWLIAPATGIVGQDADNILVMRTLGGDELVPISVDLQAGTANGGTVSNIENVVGSRFDDTILGDGNANTLLGGVGKDVLEGRDGDDALSGEAGDDTLRGDDGDDTLRGGGDNDEIDGGAGVDLIDFSDATAGIVFTLVQDTKATLVDLGGVGLGKDSYTNIEGVVGSDFADSLTGSGGNDIIFGGGGDDKILAGGDGNDILAGGTGDDIIDGGTGDDLISFADATAGIVFTLAQTDKNTVATIGGGLGTDKYRNIEGVVGSDFADLLIGSSVSDTLAGGGDNDSLSGADGDDLLFGEGGDDLLAGGLGDDTLEGGIGRDTLQGGEGADRLFGGDGDDTLGGGGGDDLLFGEAGDDTLEGGAGSDRLSGGAGENTLIGGTGDDGLAYEGFAGKLFDGGEHTDGDWLDASGVAEGVVVDLAADDDPGFGLVRLASDVGVGTRARLVNIENVTGSVFADGLVGDAADNFLRGLAGDDAVSGGGGNDVLKGGAGNDSIDGGAGVDLIDLSDASAAIIFTLVQSDIATPVDLSGVGLGTDTYRNIEGVVGSGFGDTLTGSDGDDVIVGQAGNDTLAGLSGNDLLSGGGGNDTLDGGGGLDIASYADPGATMGVDVVLDAAGNASVTDGQGGTDTLLGIEGVIGTGFDDTLIGNAGSNFLGGGGGDDTLDGGDGFDIASYADPDATTGVDVVLDAAGNASVTDGQGGTDTLLGIEGVIGTRFADTLTGNAGANLLGGGGGNDTLAGGAGDDTLDGGAGFDVASYAGSGAATGISVTLGAAGNAIVADGQGGTDTLLSIEGIIGSDVRDILIGNSLDNVLTGGAGDDVLTGGLGADTFAFASALGGTDTVLDFSLAEGDKIDLADVFAGADLSGTLAGFFVELVKQAGDTILRVDAAGRGDGFVDLAILSAVTGLGSADDLQAAGGLVV